MDTSANDDQWHHICSTWGNTAGSWNFYIDGSLWRNGAGFQTGHVIENNGIFILGQDQDSYGGGFQQDQSFLGQMYGVNMWDTVLPAEEILRLSKNCTHGVGNYLRWRDFMDADVYGDVSKASPPNCVPWAEHALWLFDVELIQGVVSKDYTRGKIL